MITTETTNRQYGINRELFLRYSLLLFSVAISFCLVLYGPEIWGGIFGLTILVVAALLISKLDLIHPYTWFTPVYFLYSVSVPLIVATGESPYLNNLKETLLVEWIALLTFLIVLGNPFLQKNELNEQQLKNASKVLYLVYILSLILTSIYLGYVFVNGLSSKYTLVLDNSPIKKVVPLFSVYILSFNLLLARNLILKKGFPIKLTIFTVGYTLLALLVIGERDLLLRVLLGCLFLYQILYKRISRKIMIIIGLIILLLVPLMADLRNIAVKENFIATKSNSLISTIANSEFAAASRNLRIVIENHDPSEYFYGKTFLWDIDMAFLKGSQSAGTWFNNTYFPGLVMLGGGNGFTIVGEGYINFGYSGVILVFTFLALFIRFLYKRATKNIIWLVIYITAIPIILYLIRGDLAVLLAQFIKHIIIPLAIIFLIKTIINKSANTRKT